MSVTVKNVEVGVSAVEVTRGPSAMAECKRSLVQPGAA